MLSPNEVERQILDMGPDFGKSMDVQNALNAYLLNLSEADLNGAWKLAQSIPNSAAAQKIRLHLLDHAAREFPEETLDLIECNQVSNQNLRAHGFSKAYQALGESGVNNVSERILTIEGEKMRQIAIQSAITGMMERGASAEMLGAFVEDSLGLGNDFYPVMHVIKKQEFKTLSEGLEFVDAFVGSAGNLEDSAYINLATEFAKVEPEATANWALGLQQGRTREVSLGRIINSWAESDIEAAGNWLNAVAVNDASLDFAVRNFTQAASNEDPVAAAGWAQSIQDPAFRRHVLIGVIDAWQRKDPDAAQTYARDLGIALK